MSHFYFSFQVQKSPPSLPIPAPQCLGIHEELIHFYSGQLIFNPILMPEMLIYSLKYKDL